MCPSITVCLQACACVLRVTRCADWACALTDTIDVHVQLAGAGAGAFLPQLVLSKSPCALLSHSAVRYALSNQTDAGGRQALLDGLLPGLYYVTLTRDFRVPFAAVWLTPLVSSNGAPARAFFLQLWFGAAVAIALLVLLMLVVTRAAVVQPYQDHPALKI